MILVFGIPSGAIGRFGLVFGISKIPCLPIFGFKEISFPCKK